MNMESRFIDVSKAVLTTIATICGWYAYKNGWSIETVVLLGIAFGFASHYTNTTKKEVKKAEKPNYHTTKDNVQKIEIIEYTSDDEINSTTYIRDQAYLSGFKKVR